jgi:hypothetical protein
MNRTGKWIIGIVLTATVGFVAVQNRITPVENSVTQTPGINEAVTSIPESPCAYVWAYHDAPELTKEIDVAIRDINPAASARAELYGEDCVYADGHSTFGATETDFHVRLPTDDLTNNEAFGDWMAQVMPIVAEIPREEIQGNYGFVEFWFEKNDTEHLIVHVPIQQYVEKSQGKTGAELFQIFYVTP